MSYRVGIDVGGTFTDLVAVAPDGSLEIRKVLSTPDDPSEGLFRALDVLAVDNAPIEALIHGTTIATNALLERRGARTVLVTSAGFEDLLWLRRQDRASLYDLSRDHPPPLVRRDDVVGVAERMGADGVVTPLSDAEVARVTAAVRERSPEAVAVTFLFAFRHPDHERRVAAALRAALPGIPVVASHDVVPLFREYERCATTTAEAYLRPLVTEAVTRAAAGVARRGIGTFRLMASGGGTLSAAAAAESAAALALSGPVGGVVGAQLLGEALGHRDLLTLDMGGTSADASLIQGGVASREGSTAVGGVPLALPAVLIETVSAGGGSIAWVDDAGTLKVGPRSAGARPGPACFGRGGEEPTVTDACLALGWLDPDWALADAVQLDAAAAEQALRRLRRALGMDVRVVAAGVVAVATAVMARALKRVSVARGEDPRSLALVPFGGAGPLFGCALADLLGMRTVIVPAHPGVLSALGLAAAAERMEVVGSVHQRAAALQRETVLSAYAALEARAAGALPGAQMRRLADCRFAGQGYEITVPLTDGEPDSIEAAFHAAHRARYGHLGAGGAVEVVNVRVVAERAGGRPAWGRRAGIGRPTPGSRRIVVGGKTVRAQIWPLGELPPRLRIPGPAILAGPDATGVVEPGWRGTVTESGAVMLERT
ncbi:MAG TPA: hydantoinase/oxoprolinase family protein [Gemmatimonadales bacterium]|nr:hydantoinase/oxoprolinase family protein [Gemmatimonadales bacterium]